MSKAIAALVRLGLDTQDERKREFFKKLKANLERDDPAEHAKIEWDRLPKEKWAHLRDRAKQRQISLDDLFSLSEWKAKGPRRARW